MGVWGKGKKLSSESFFPFPQMKIYKEKGLIRFDTQ